MTVAPTGTSAVEGYDENYANVGLEDVEASDLRIPRININHVNAVFVNSLTKEEWPALTVITLGLIKQRILWPSKMGDDPKPLCKSPDNTHGFPNMDPASPKSKQFPWGASNFTPEDAQPKEILEGDDPKYPKGWSSNGYGVLSCSACAFAKWGQDEDGKRTPPPCNEQHTYPLLYMQEITAEDGQTETLWVPAILTVQRSAIADSRKYINGFAQAQQAFFTQYTGITLRQTKRGTNEFCIPEFRKMGPTDRNHWGEYGKQFVSIREFLRSAPRPQDETETAQSESNENTAPVTVASEPQAPPTQEAAPPPVAPVTPKAPSAPPKPPTPPRPPAAPTAPTTPAATATAPDDDGLPF